MGIVLHSQRLVDAPVYSQGESRLKKMFMNWITRNENLKRQWKNYAELSAGGRVSYRAWSRHGAYIALSREMRD